MLSLKKHKAIYCKIQASPCNCSIEEMYAAFYFSMVLLCRLRMDNVSQCVLTEDFLAKFPLFPKCVCLYPALYNVKCFQWKIQDEPCSSCWIWSISAKCSFLLFWFPDICGFGACADSRQRGCWALKVLLGKKETGSWSYFRWLISLQYRLLLSEAGNVLDTQLGIALLRQKPAVIKPDSWHTQDSSQLFVRVTLFVLMLVSCWW